MNAFEYRPKVWSLFKEENQQIVAEVKSFQKRKVKKKLCLNLLYI